MPTALKSYQRLDRTRQLCGFFMPVIQVCHAATFLEAAQLLSCYKFGKELAWEPIAFTREESRRAKGRPL